MNNLEPTVPLPFLLSEQLDPSWLEERSAAIAKWRESPHKQWITAGHDIDWAIAEGSHSRIDAAFASLHELTAAPEYDITVLPYRGAKMILAYENAFRQRLRSQPIGRKIISATYRNWVSVGREISNAEFTKDPGRPLSSLSEIVLLGTQMRAKNPRRFPFVSLPREESHEGDSFTNHDGYLLKVNHDGSLEKDPWEITSGETKKYGTHPEVREIPVTEIISGVLHSFSGIAESFEHLKSGTAKRLAQLRIVTGLLEKDAYGHLKGVDLWVLNRVTGGLEALIRGDDYITATPGAVVESEMARQLRTKFGNLNP